MRCREWHAAVWALLLACALAGCTFRTARIPSPVQRGDSIDLQPGWRLRVVTPILKSGGYRLNALNEQTGGNTITIAGSDFLGYETAYYAVKARRCRGVRVEFTSADRNQNGETRSEDRPLVRLFQLPRRDRYVRLIYLLRSSRADHDMAVVAAAGTKSLEILTEQLEADPTGGCRSSKTASCSWIPDGIAVRAEVQKNANGEKQWEPVR
ncbi:MAG TPA: hypothetical protein VJN43_16915 [Bryobacteraceae bacterium]|nr:hypothetical protein [Bryobacteraceae bacterium]